ncbi:ABC transporter ATP-binding protein [Rhizobium sp. FKL33]|uniref:ABC transporter ATP-binding protein n=1 Tax=Rhizobium sp. FKL33 TaxID=2562307 RepID=UPI0010BF6FB4|nr:ABC transporter ATP-binding protein [Rhizobium sp. FKL33]
MTTVLDIRDLVVEGRRPGGEAVIIVNGVSLNVGKGEVLALIGESGSGKSTISLSAMGFARPGCRIASGAVELNGRDIMALTPTERHALRGREAAYIAQSAAASFNPAIRIGPQVIEAPVFHRVADASGARAAALELYRQLDLPNPETVERRFPHQVSGGQLQRLMAAMAMSSSPDLLILDEPTTALDVTTQIEVLKAFKRMLREKGTAAIYVTHDLAVVAQIADRIMVLRNGVVVEEGEAAQILLDPRHAYTRQLMAAHRPASRQIGADPQPDASPPSLSLRGVSAGYGAMTILSDVTFDIARGAVVGVIGESGCGKSTLARVVAGLTPARSGSVEINGKAAAPMLADRKRSMLQDCQMVFQMADTALNPRHRVADILGRPLTFYHGLKGRRKAERVAELLALVDLPADFAERYPAALSGGQKQRVNLARALAADPTVILCDEVTSALDTVVAAGVIELLDNLKTRLGISYLFISHDLSTVSSFADRIVVLYAGRVVEQGSTREVFQPPWHPYTKLLLGSAPKLEQGWLDRVSDTDEARAAKQGSVVHNAAGCAFANRCARVIPGLCDVVAPPIREPAPGHQIACHLDLRGAPLR